MDHVIPPSKVDSLLTFLQSSFLKPSLPTILIGRSSLDANGILIRFACTFGSTWSGNLDTIEFTLCSTNQPESIGTFMRTTTRAGHFMGGYTTKTSTNISFRTPNRIATWKVDALAIRWFR